MKHLILLIISIILISCSNQNELIGKWEKIEQNDLKKSQIEIYRLGDFLFGKRIQLSKINIESGWTINDICWKNIQKKENNLYLGTRIAKRIYNGKVETKKIDIFINIKNDSIIAVKTLYTDNNLTDGKKTVLYKKINNFDN